MYCWPAFCLNNITLTHISHEISLLWQVTHLQCETMVILQLFVQPLPELGFTPWICYFLSEFRLNLCSHYILWHSCLKIHHHWQREDFLQIITHRKSLLWIRRNSRSNPLWSLDSDRPGCHYNLFHHMRAVQILCSKLQQASGEECLVWGQTHGLSTKDLTRPDILSWNLPYLPFTAGREAGEVKCISASLKHLLFLVVFARLVWTQLL